MPRDRFLFSSSSFSSSSPSPHHDFPPSSSPPSSSSPVQKWARISSKRTRSAIKKFGPFFLTGLAAVAEHHWLKKGGGEESHHSSFKDSKEAAPHDDDDDDDKMPATDRDHRERAEIRRLREEVKRLRRDVERKKKKKGKERRDFRERRHCHDGGGGGGGGEEEVEEEEEREREEDYPRSSPRPPSEPGPEWSVPFAPTPPFSFPTPRLVREEREWARRAEYGYSEDYEPAPARRSGSRTRRRRGSAGQVGNHHDASDHAVQAGKVAAVAGMVEALHVDGGKGDWIGSKGLRVGTTVAASLGATYLRGRDAEEYRMREVVADVGTGVLVSRLVYGNPHRGDSEEEEEERPVGGMRKRRWSHWV
ncbi:hypothetical protein MBM_02059 [Drepanopeziza brunnea f. sp. 'multigermtubi' MB_m1]|uniref:Uncharacterized protein n=1 Tax=Marssonina brunnea f. sp. multigermtubi (strain MB_m1) TaxID=1072389 RepID=K1X4U6_MARBU|nr:uncharacterized protein MBM_02059 [Drepanopeziza brunnea f. sp. 'multigermtubi' MB_m1]EKD20107.1 hypothetical protein MBM_02059 [Drepanopeziza brunnea f. sp. 'multigermtubi' MB_m1]